MIDVVPPRRQLAARRRAIGHSQESLAQVLDVRAQSVARWEQGTTTPLARYRRPLAEVLDLTLAELEYLLDAPDQALATPGQQWVPQWMDHYTSLEQGAAKLQTFEPIAIPGLLQIEAYAVGVMESSHLPVSDDVLRARVEARMARQSVLQREPHPLELHCVLDESVLRRVTGDPSVMTAQLDHVCEAALTQSVVIQVVAASSSALHCAAFGSFRLFTSPAAPSPFIACTEDLTGFNYLDRPEAIEAHAALFDHLTSVALPPTESLALVGAVAEQFRSEAGSLDASTLDLLN